MNAQTPKGPTPLFERPSALHRAICGAGGLALWAPPARWAWEAEPMGLGLVACMGLLGIAGLALLARSAIAERRADFDADHGVVRLSTRLAVGVSWSTAIAFCEIESIGIEERAVDGAEPTHALTLSVKGRPRPLGLSEFGSLAEAQEWRAKLREVLGQ